MVNIEVAQKVKERLEKIKEEFQTKSYSDTILVLILEYEKLKLQYNKDKNESQKK